MTPANQSVPRLKLLAAYAAVFFVWGSTFLFIHFGLQQLPPFVLAALRFLLAGTILYTWMRLSGAAAPKRDEWWPAFVTGALFFLCGNGAVVWSQQRLPSGIVALIVAIIPLWVVLLEWLRPPHRKPGALVIMGVLLGLLGLVLLVLVNAGEATRIDPVAALVLAGGSLCWAYGTLYAQRTPQASSPLLSVSMQLLAGGALLTLVALLRGEPWHTPWSSLTAVTIGSVLYLAFFGSILAFSAYIWLVRVAPAARVATYAYVNPVVAMVLGWLFAQERLTSRTLLASAIVLAGVALVTLGTTSGRTIRPAQQRRAAA